MLYTISKEFEFSASHQLGGLPDDHPCSRLHGHNYVLRVSVEGDLDEVGFVMDYRALAPLKEWVDEHLDHRHLNERMRANPTSELLVRYIAAQLANIVHFPHTVYTVTVAVSETRKTWASASFHASQLRDTVAVDEDRWRWGRDHQQEAA